MIAPENPDWQPQFIMTGAVKAATTWIQAQLQANPDVYLPDPEPHFFSQSFEEGKQYYRRFFDHAPKGAIIGEKSADYLAHEKAPARIAALLPDVRLVAQLRDPVKRAYSDYKMFFRRGWVSGTPEEYLTSLDNPHPRFLQDGLYGRHLRRWLDHFPREALLLLKFEDIATNQRAVIEKVSRHIGAEPYYDEALAARKQNNSAERFLPLPMRKALAPFKSYVKPLRGNAFFEYVRSKIASEIEYPKLSPELERRLREFYRQDLEQLEDILGCDLTRWKEAPVTDEEGNLSKSGALRPEELYDLS